MRTTSCTESPPHRRALPRRAGDETGWTLVELLLAATIMIVVLSAVLGVLEGTSKVAFNDQERSTALNEDSGGVQKMVNEISRAYQVNYPTSGTSSDVFDFDVRIIKNGSQQDRRVQYICNTGSLSSAYNECLRYEDSTSDPAPYGQAMTSVTPTIVVPRVVNETTADSNDPVFQNLSSPDGSTGRPTYGEAVVHTPSLGSRQANSRTHWVTIDDAFDIRQLALAH